MRTTYSITREEKELEVVSLYQIYLNTNSDFHESHHNAHARRIVVDLTEKGKLEFFLYFPDPLNDISPVFLSPKGKLEVRYKSEKELDAILSMMQWVLVPKSEESIQFIIKSQTIPNKILDLETRIMELELRKKEIINGSNKGIGLLKVSYNKMLSHVEEELNQLGKPLFLMKQQRITYKKGQKWSFKLHRFI